MPPTIEEQIERLKNTIAEMEAQRDALGDAVVKKAIEPLHEKLAELNHLLEASQAPPPEIPTQQRKLLTILFMDIAESTAMIQHMDPEDVSQVIDHNLKRLAQPIEDYGGKVTRFMGDGYMAVFGAPVAREDDPERAVRAGLTVIQRSEEIALELKREWGIQEFKVRVGIHTGLVVLGGETEGQDTTEGPAVHLAARLQSTAPPGGLLISYDSYRHVRGVFNAETWEPNQVQGFDEPVQVYHILSAKPRAFRSYTRGVEGVETCMVGRHSELKYLQDALLSAMEDHEGQVVTIRGEAGVGKSRLLYELQNWIDLQPTNIRFYEGRAHQESQGVPYATLRDLFEFRFQLQDNDSKETVQRKVEAGFMEVFAEAEEAQMRAHLLGQWLGFDFSASPHLQAVISDPEQLRNRGLLYLGEYFRDLCRMDPVVVFLEDLHWADDSSLDVLNWLGERLQHQRWLCVDAARHSLFERRPYWGEGLAFHHRLELEPLSKRESHQLVGEILKLAEHVPSELVELVVEGAEGNPFYVEELVKMLVEDGVVVKGEEQWEIKPERLSEIKVPSTLAGVLQARLDSLPVEEHRVLQQASVVGRQFWDRVVAYIQAAEGGKPQGIPEALTSLRNREMIYRREASAFMDANEYLFKHDILRDVTYESVLKRQRSEYHGMIADWLIGHVGERVGEYSGMIAGHLLLAGRRKQACEYFLQAGEAALASFANHEAEGYFRQVLELAPTNEQRAECLSGLGDALRLRGSRQEAVDIYRQCIDLFIQLENRDRAAELYARLSRVLFYDDSEAAWNACQEGLKRLEGAPVSPGMASLLAETGRAGHFWTVDKDEVASYCERAIDVARQVGNIDTQLDAGITLAMATEIYKKNNPKGCIKALESLAAQAEANGLPRPAARAYHNIGFCLSALLYNERDNWKYYLRSAECWVQIGDIDGLFYVLGNFIDNLIALGNLKSIKPKLEDILDHSIATESQIEMLLRFASDELLLPRGEWEKSLEYQRVALEQYRQRGSYQSIGNLNLTLAKVIFELNHFGEPCDLAEAEAALLENIGSGFFRDEARFGLAVLACRQGSLVEARERLAEAIAEVPVYPDSVRQRLYAEAELARAEGCWDAAISAYERLFEYDQKGGLLWQQARRLIDLGDCLISRGDPGDEERAREAYKQSLEMFTEMDAPGYIRVLEERLGDL